MVSPILQRCVRSGCLLLAAAGSLLGAPSSHADNDALDRLIVTATGREQPIEHVVAAVQIIDRATLDLYPGATVADALRQATGVQAFSAGSTDRVGLRGFNSTQTLVLVDGLRRASRFGGQNLAALPIESIERIEIIRGPMSALYGADALGGVVNIITRKPTFTGMDNARLSYGQADNGGRETWIGSAALGLVSEHSSQRIAYERRQRSPLEQDANGADVYNRQRLDALDWSGQWSMSTQHTLDWRLEYQDQDDLGLRFNPPRGPQAGFLWPSVEQDQRGFGALGYDGELDAGQRLRATVSRSTTDGAARRQPDLLEVTDYTIDQAELRGFLPLGRDVLALGAGFQREDFFVTINQRTARREVWHALVQHEGNPGGQLSWVAGLRHDDYSDFGSTTNPRVGVLLQIGEGWQLRGNAGRAFRAPSFLDQFASFVRGTNLITGNPDLKPERSTMLELALTRAWRGGELSLDAYQARVDDLVRAVLTGERQGNLNILRYRNIDRARLRGVEARAAHRLGSGIGGELSWEWLDNIDRDSDQRLLGSSRQRINARVDARLGEFTLGARAHRLIDFYNRRSPAAPAFDENYLRIDLFGEYRINPAWRVFAGVDNVLDRADPQAASLNVTSDPGGRYFTLGLRYGAGR